MDDLIGLRVLHLFKEQWLAIHEYVMHEWDLKEPPIAYYREGDAADVIEAFKASGCQPRVHPDHYRSVHYILQIPLSKQRAVTAELQVRTLSEEGWSEVDHLVRYPNATDNDMVNMMSSLLNRAAGMADEMSTGLQQLKSYIDESASQALQQQQQQQVALQELEEARRTLADTVEKLAVGESEKKKLQKQIEAMGQRMDTVSEQRVSQARSPLELAMNLFGNNESVLGHIESVRGGGPLSDFGPLAKALDPDYSPLEFLGKLSPGNANAERGADDQPKAKRPSKRKEPPSS